MIRLPTLLRWRPGRLAMNTLRGSTMYGVRLAFQALYFILLARLLGVEQFGVFSGIWVLCGFLATFAGMGFPVLAFRTASLSPTRTAECAGRGFRVMLFTALPLALLLVGISLEKFPDSPRIAVLVLMAFSEIVLVPVLTLLASAHQGNERLGRSHTLFASLWIARAVALSLLSLATRPDLLLVMSTHALVTAGAAATWLYLDRQLVVSPLKVSGPTRAEILNGASFAVSGAAMIAYTELNQSITLALSGAAAAGLLAVAYKVVALSSAPLSAMCQAVSPRLLRAANSPQLHLRGLLGGMLAPLLAAAAACSVAVLIAATFIPLVFGPNYAAAERVARALFILPVFTSVRVLSVYVLMAKSRQSTRVVAELGCLVFGLSLNAYLISKHGLSGAVLAILVTESLTAAILSALALKVLRSQTPIEHASV